MFGDKRRVRNQCLVTIGGWVLVINIWRQQRGKKSMFGDNRRVGMGKQYLVTIGG